MNFFDAYDISGTATAPANTQPTQRLNEEVSEVVGQLSRFWGGFRKQVGTLTLSPTHSAQHGIWYPPYAIEPECA